MAAVSRERMYTAPVFLGSAFLLFGLALLEKVLNLFGYGIPLVQVFPRQLLEWAVIVLMFEIALTLRQLVDLRQSGEEPASDRPVSPNLH